MCLCMVAPRHPPLHVILVGALNIPDCKEVTFDGDNVFSYNSANGTGGERNSDDRAKPGKYCIVTRLLDSQTVVVVNILCWRRACRLRLLEIHLQSFCKRESSRASWRWWEQKNQVEWKVWDFRPCLTLYLCMYVWPSRREEYGSTG